LLALGIHVAKSTIQTYMRGARPPQGSGQTWATFLYNHAADLWACDFLPVTDVLFRPLYAFFMIELASRRVVHVGVTGQPTDAWVAPQLRKATPFGQRPRYIIRDNDSTFGPAFARRTTMASTSRGLTSSSPRSASVSGRTKIGSFPIPSVSTARRGGR